jgi:thiamine-phosphate diphosphorylase
MAAELRLPCLCLVADCSVVDPDELTARVAAAVEGGVSLVQLRAKEMAGGLMLSLTQELDRATAGRAILLVNERVDVAATANASGVQLGEQALPAPAARRLLPSGSIIGRSVHSVEGALKATADGADFLVVGTMFATSSHPGEEPAGPSLMRDLANRCSLPLIGIGGITPERVDAVIEAGGSGVAVIRSILAADDPGSAAREMRSALEESWQRYGAVLDNGMRHGAGRSS